MTAPTAKVEDMSYFSRAYGKTDDVVEGLPDSGSGAPARRRLNALKRLCSMLCALLALVLWITPVSYADDDDTDGDESTSETTDGGVTITSSITDTENLLGSDVSTVTDAIDDTYEQTGVSVRLLYLATFATDDDPEDWARDVLDSTEPDPNTVMLAVASYDGSLVVAVSSNSDDWLLDQDTVDELSQAALDPLVDDDTPDWSGSALAMMDAIVTASQTATSRSDMMIGILIMAAVLVVLIAIIVLAVVLRRRSRASHARGGRTRADADKRLGGKRSKSDRRSDLDEQLEPSAIGTESPTAEPLADDAAETDDATAARPDDDQAPQSGDSAQSGDERPFGSDTSSGSDMQSGSGAAADSTSPQDDAFGTGALDTDAAQPSQERGRSSRRRSFRRKSKGRHSA